MIRATVIADSISPACHRLVTMEVTMPRCILAEMNTHRAFSRSSASSRAVPVRKMLDQVLANPFVPLRWESAQAGMQGGHPLDGEAADRARDAWLDARDFAVRQAQTLLDAGLHKTMPNRLLEPFMWHTAIISATDWDGFWAQRCSPLAEIHMQATAEAMRDAYRASEPRKLAVDEWHLPYIRSEDLDRPVEELCAISAARCARVSYLTHDGRRDPDEDLRLYDKLVSAVPRHESPLEHVATPNTPISIGRHLGNFAGWVQLRHWGHRRRPEMDDRKLRLVT